MRILWLVLVERLCCVVAPVGYWLSGGIESAAWGQNCIWERLTFWCWSASFSASMERDYRRDGLWPTRGQSDGR